MAVGRKDSYPWERMDRPSLTSECQIAALARSAQASLARNEFDLLTEAVHQYGISPLGKSSCL
jgi:hypothetical protein